MSHWNTVTLENNIYNKILFVILIIIFNLSKQKETDVLRKLF